jgi:hypothetical protein
MALSTDQRLGLGKEVVNKIYPRKVLVQILETIKYHR